MDIYPFAHANTCQAAMNLLAHEPGAERDGESVIIKRKIAAPGTISDGTRTIYIRACPRYRWIEAKTYSGEILAEADQRDFWERPGAMAKHIMDNLG